MMDEGPLKLAQAKRRRDLEAELRDLSNQVAALGRSLAHERGRSLAEGGALRALEIAVGGAKARVGGAFRARDRAWERLRQQQEAGRGLWAELEAARAAREGAELRAQEAESQCREKEAELQRLRQAVAAAQRARRRAEQERDDVTAHVPRPPSPTCRGDHDPAGLQAALLELRAHNRELRQRLQQRHEEAQELQRALMGAQARSRAAAEGRAELEREQRGLQGRLRDPGVTPHPAEAALTARCLHLQELLQREAGVVPGWSVCCWTSRGPPVGAAGRGRRCRGHRGLRDGGCGCCWGRWRSSGCAGSATACRPRPPRQPCVPYGISCRRWRRGRFVPRLRVSACAGRWRTSGTAPPPPFATWPPCGSASGVTH
ncbi:myosin heavy chain, embryonic smooth muscle isoform-like isoform X2 [Gallus gallus]|uniref:myosin heavy chain, embryonic smooth muscle isoform-like isoform X2 n=1 Tax=Gallus gallus TaxID=9031 RepID=UPI001AE7395D|nr:myosin heavy chain, embryonic smooth muscle isoform-like isoform X2 [Gallus gallus]XP_040549258.1 myosin heavy chain, embryonic smooth muscle isoform-like isoform X2 [Gallus gallus]